MTTPVAPTITDISRVGDRSALLVQWATVTENNTYQAVNAADYTAKSVQIAGTFGGSTTVLNGSNDGTNYAGLNTLQGSAISATGAALKSVQESTVWIQPSSSSGSGQSLTVSLLLQRSGTPFRS